MKTSQVKEENFASITSMYRYKDMTQFTVKGKLQLFMTLIV